MEEKPKGRPVKEKSISDVIVTLKSAIADTQLLTRNGKLAGMISLRVTRDLAKLIKILDKRA